MLSSCGEADLPFEGTWSATASLMDTLMKDKVTFTKDSYTQYIQVYNSSTSKWVNYVKTSGKLSSKGTIMTLTCTSIGVSSVDITGTPTGTIVEYKEGSAEFKNLLDLADQDAVTSAQYSVSGKELILKIDENNDGDFTDDGETVIYTKE